MLTLRPYQRTGVNDVMRHWRDGVIDVLFVMPTGGGKSVCLAEMVRRARASGANVLWVVHRIELVEQAKKHLLKAIGSLEGIYIETIQTLIARNLRPQVGLVVFDEAHHLAADDWGRLPDYYKHVRTVGATATPERSDGRPLGDIFQKMVVPINYRQLIADGHLVDCRVFRPAEGKGSDLAKAPIEAYRKYAEGGTGFCFVRTIEDARDLTGAFSHAGIPADYVVATTDKVERENRIDRLRRGTIKMLVNVYTMTEGVDIPAAQVCLLARGCGHVSTYLQMVGRVLRPHPSKPYGILIDLPGVSHTHGVPTEDRTYSLEGEAITQSSVGSLSVCQRCGYTYETETGPECPNCGFRAPAPKKKQKVYDEELVEAFAIDGAPNPLKVRELQRLRNEAQLKRRSVLWVARKFKEMFGHPPPHWLFRESELRAEYLVLKKAGQAKKYRPGWASNMYRARFGVYPKRSWG